MSCVRQAGLLAGCGSTYIRLVGASHTATRDSEASTKPRSGLAARPHRESWEPAAALGPDTGSSWGTGTGSDGGDE